MNSPRDWPAFVPARQAATPASDPASLRQRALDVLPAIGEGSARRERERQLPFLPIRQLAEAGLLTWRVPREHGGPGASVAEVIRFVIDLASVDSNIAQALRPAFGFVETLRLSPAADEHARWYPRVLAGDLVGNAGWERGGPNGEVKATLRRSGDHWIANGTKYYSTGALYADWVSTFALDEAGVEVAFVVPRDREGLDLVDDFDAMGQRLTASGTTRYSDVRVEDGERRHLPMHRDRRSPIPPFYQLYLAAIEAGIAHNALQDGTRFVQHHARPIRHSSAARSVDDPYVQWTIGEIAAQAYTADAVVMAAARSIDEAWADGLSAERLTQASIDVAQAQVGAIAAALKAGELVFDLGSASATSREHNLDRHWRNARTVANHNPRHWKGAVVGAHQLTGAEPPTSGLF
ncbi:MAG: acyl-CoA dehydrogenase family protein [Hydrogenophaga sp.]|uniref:acyl-CoA dehydrogenase family protein n=1 Tax=Hydrogenophaga sp. TaxID=1904254 RepID=UPI00257E2693|nr:acyl-CoA dehydrogenase family protein [Hydrogenophaga sp.]MBL0946243.1 acyl-CoA dehydrogenase family protein [Hydrogenophaga sp.]